MAPHLLIVHHDPAQAASLKASLAQTGYAATAVTTMREARRLLEVAKVDPIALILLDVGSPSTGGLQWLQGMQEEGTAAAAPRPHHPGQSDETAERKLTEYRKFAQPVIALTSADDFEAAMHAMHAGAVDFMVLPADPERLRVSLQNALRLTVLEQELSRAERTRLGISSLSDIVTVSTEMMRVVDLARRAASSGLPVLLQGERGSGRKTLAHGIHGESRRATKPFVVMNCGPAVCSGKAAAGGVCETAGSFQEKLREADGGTLYIDDIANASPELQAALFETLTRADVPQSDARIVCATHQDLIALVKAGRFREDLFYRLNVLPVLVPPLRHREGDIEAITRHLIVRYAAEEGKTVTGIDEEALTLLKRYTWPRNVQQLENAVFRAVAMAKGHTLGVKAFPQIAARVEGFETELQNGTEAQPKQVYEGPAMIGGGFPAMENLSRRGPHGQPGVGIPALNENGDIRPLTAMEADMIRLALGHYRGHMTEVARRLGIGRSTLYRKMREFGLDLRMH
jgi:DNA-binding NtrC family response regulator